MKRLSNNKKLLFLDIAPTFRDVADLVEGIDCLEDLVNQNRKDKTIQNPQLRERLMVILRRMDRLDARYYEKEQ